MNISSYIKNVCADAKKASGILAIATSEEKNKALTTISEIIQRNCQTILNANRKDLDKASKNQLDGAMVDRLTLTEKTISTITQGIREITKLADPVAEISPIQARPSGIGVAQMRVPIGVIGIIYESRPNVTADAASLCLKSGNAVILRGGSESFFSNQAIGKCITEGLDKTGLPPEAIQLIATTNRDAVGELLKQEEQVDLIIPRGGKNLIRRVSEESKIPVLKHLDGICHVYIDKKANHSKAIAIAVNAKTQRYGTCNTMETLLIHSDCAPTILPKISKILREEKVELRADHKARIIIPEAKIASKEDWKTEYLGPTLSVGIVESVEDAILHIAKYGSNHTDCIVTEDKTTANKFLRQVDSSSVMLNTSTRFADGFEYGLGAEIGISTDKLHARGPVGLEGLTSLKWVVYGDGHTRT